MPTKSQLKNTSEISSLDDEASFLNTDNEWKRIVDELPDLIFVINLKHEIVYMNKTMLSLLQSDPSDVIGKMCFTCVHGSQCLLENCLHEKMLLDRKTHMLELYDDRLGGNVEMRVVPYFNTSGEIIGSFHIVRNVNDRIESQKEKENLQLQLLRAQKLESVGQLASGIAHEINTPIQFINTNISFIQESFNEVDEYIKVTRDFLGKFSDTLNKNDSYESLAEVIQNFDWEYLEEEIPRSIEQSKEGLNRVSSIVQAMKAFSHPGGESKVESDINRIILTTVTISRNEWKYVSVVETSLDDNLFPVWCDVDSVSQVILNMIINAAHSIESKLGRNPVGQKGNIEISTKQKDGFVEIQISDTGTGVPDNIKNRIFDPFFTTKDVGKGTGQGLAISHDIICAKHHGRIELKSEEGVGATFIIELPNDPKGQVN